MSHKKLRPFIIKVSVLGYFPLYSPTFHCFSSQPFIIIEHVTLIVEILLFKIIILFKKVLEYLISVMFIQNNFFYYFYFNSDYF